MTAMTSTATIPLGSIAASVEHADGSATVWVWHLPVERVRAELDRLAAENGTAASEFVSTPEACVASSEYLASSAGIVWIDHA